MIGATSFLGPSVIEKFIDSGQDIKFMIRAENRSKSLSGIVDNSGGNASFVGGDLLDPDSMIDALKGVSGIVYMVDLVKTDLLENFLSAVSRTRVKRAVFISSTTVLLPTKSDVKEKKLQSEKLIKESGLDHTILRPTMIYGVSGDPNFSKMLEFIKRRGFFITFGNGRNLIQPVYIGDVAQAVLDTFGNRATNNMVYELAGKKSLEYNDMTKIVRETSGIDFKVFRFPIGPSKAFVSIFGRLSKRFSLTPGQIERMGIDKAYSYEDAQRDFNFSPISFEEGIKKLLKNMGELS
ncbi:MAG: NAD(P)H-binding protein [Candidatus Humimicrobiaceae bacterium]